MSMFGLTAAKAKELHAVMMRLKIFEKDIKEDFVRSSGPGGQNVNKVSTCVVLCHIPSGIIVKSQKERSQGLNRYIARCQLIKKIEQSQKSKQRKIIQDQEKKRRQNRKRSPALKEKILEEKWKQSQRKKSRRKITNHKSEEYY